LGGDTQLCTSPKTKLLTKASKNKGEKEK